MPAVSPANSTHAGALSDKAESLLRKRNTGPFAANDLTTWRLSLSASLCQPHVQQCTSPPATKCKPHHGLVTPVASLALTYKDISHTTMALRVCATGVSALRAYLSLPYKHFATLHKHLLCGTIHAHIHGCMQHTHHVMLLLLTVHSILLCPQQLD